MPELAAAYSIGFLITLITSLIFTALQLKRYSSKAYLQLQKNLELIDLQWNDLNGSLQEPKEKQIESEIKKARHTYFIIAFIASILSWFGLFFLILMWVSVKKLIKNRLEVYLFTSSLAQSDLTVEQVQAHYEIFKTLAFD
ncbi:MAG: hypothetical protein ACXVAX_11675 [Pseudobdellovibrio sp.]